MAIKTGQYDISNDQYHGGEGISRSAIMQFRKSPFHYWNSYLNPERPGQPLSEEDEAEPTDALAFGHALHNYILEPDKFSERFMIIEKINRTTKAGKIYWADVQAAKGIRETVYEENFFKIEKIAKTIKKDPRADSLVTGAQYEQSLYWTDPESGILCKARPDILHPDRVGDLKTAISASEREFSSAVFKYGAYIQAAMIHEALLHVHGIDVQLFYYIVLEKKYPYAHCIYKLDYLYVEHGIAVFKKALLEMRECINKNMWPSYPPKIITTPPYAN